MDQDSIRDPKADHLPAEAFSSSFRSSLTIADAWARRSRTLFTWPGAMEIKHVIVVGFPLGKRVAIMLLYQQILVHSLTDVISFERVLVDSWPQQRNHRRTHPSLRHPYLSALDYIIQCQRTHSSNDFCAQGTTHPIFGTKFGSK